MARVVLQNVTKVYPNGIVALRGVSLSIEPGEFVFLVGSSGAGKSTLLRLLYRAEVPTEGEVWVDGVEVSRLRPREVPRLRRRMGVVFQDFKLLRDRTVAENVGFALRVTGAPPGWIPSRVRWALEMVGLLDRADAFPHELSGGEQQRVAIARAIALRPGLLLADEPTGNLDPQTSWEIMRLLVRIHLHGATVVMATHNRLLVDILRRRVVELAEGRVVRDEAWGGYLGDP
ncbi:MAG: cell division ATP-binding protein FtsE [Armatimonadota bacterium]|nr:cell division ATP-binding protein FtsE [Armatimonadota bacterium]MDR7438660.1 cell division ATP-binding protein FtsE [Armatimonadota bacterium]MDR7568286.1 cell division ATP-binding protein FtsE [Armatimonadota bacterium]MDR7601823.1 cell division ATP-binding protein FtsE [Armatimonadota bacterium]